MRPEPTLRPLAAIYFLEPMRDGNHGQAARVGRVPAAEGFRLLLSEAHCMSLRDPACNRKMVRNYLSVARLVPVFRLSFASGLDRISTVLDSLGLVPLRPAVESGSLARESRRAQGRSSQ